VRKELHNEPWRDADYREEMIAYLTPFYEPVTEEFKDRKKTDLDEINSEFLVIDNHEVYYYDDWLYHEDDFWSGIEERKYETVTYEHETLGERSFDKPEDLDVERHAVRVGTRPGITRQLENEIERRIFAIGAILLAIGFSLQILHSLA